MQFDLQLSRLRRVYLATVALLVGANLAVIAAGDAAPRAVFRLL